MNNVEWDAVFPSGVEWNATFEALAVFPVPAAPSGLAAVALSPSSVRLTWTDNSDDETGFLIEVSTDGGTNWSTVTTTAADVVTYDDTGLTTNITYTYRVTAVGEFDNSAPSNEANILIVATVTNVETVYSKGSITISWDAVTGADSYTIKRGPAGGPYTGIETGVVGTSTTDDTTVLNGNTVYAYVVVAVIGSYSGFDSDESSVRNAKLYDAFAGSGSADAHSPDIGSATPHTTVNLYGGAPTGTATLSGGRLTISGNYTGISFDTGSADQHVSVDWLPQVGVANRAEIALRFGGTERYQFVCREAEGDISIRYINPAGSLTTLTTDAFAFVDGTTYNIRARAIGGELTMWIDDVLLLQTTDSTLTTGNTAAIGNNNPSTAQVFDNLDVVATSTIAISAPEAYQIYQRDGSDFADIAIAGTYTGSHAGLQARFNGGAWETVSTVGGGSYNHTLANQATGQGSIQVRVAEEHSDVRDQLYVGIGDVFLVAGQSNAEGRFNTFFATSHPTLKAGMYRFGDNVWAELVDSTGGGGKGSVWPYLADRIMAGTGIPVGFVTGVAFTGTRLLVHWSQGDTQYNNAVTAVAGSGVANLKAILWYQGESDAVNGLSQSAYQAGLSAMLDDMQSDMGVTAPLIAALIGPITSATDARIDAIRAAIIDRWVNDADIYAGPVAHNQDFADNVHWSTDAEATTLSNLWWRTIEAALYGGSESARGHQYSSGLVSGTDITLTFTGGEGALQNQTDTVGWEVSDDNGTRTVNSASGTSSTVTLTCDQALVGTVVISWCSGSLIAVGGTEPTLQDSGTYPLPPEPFSANLAV